MGYNTRGSKESWDHREENGSESGIPQKNQDQEGKGIPQEDDKNDKNQKKISEEGKESLKKDQFLAIEISKESEGNESDLFIAYESSGLEKAPERRGKEELFQKEQCLEIEISKESEGNESDLFIAYESSVLEKSPERREKEELFQKDQCLEREKSKDEIKESAMDIAAKSYDIGLKKTSEEEEKKEVGVQTDKVKEERSHENTVSSESSSIGKGMIKTMANSASEAVTRLANRFSEEDTQKKLLCAGAAILVTAVGIYASFKLRSMTRQ
ncbi:hypothetical protein K1719_024638 [Acacia pycnantha]|nr:hypothetical protein K1719_024638 [Acacia pycnantha]